MDEFFAEKVKKMAKIWFSVTIAQPAATPLQHQTFCPRYAHALELVKNV